MNGGVEERTIREARLTTEMAELIKDKNQYH